MKKKYLPTVILICFPNDISKLPSLNCNPCSTESPCFIIKLRVKFWISFSIVGSDNKPLSDVNCTSITRKIIRICIFSEVVNHPKKLPSTLVKKGYHSFGRHSLNLPVSRLTYFCAYSKL